MHNVFGKPVTDEVVKKVTPEYYDQKKVTKKDRARAAMLLRDHEGRAVQARTFLEEYRNTYTGNYINWLVYNATGDAVTFGAYKHWALGNRASIPYPVVIQNGQWAALLHTMSPNETVAFTYQGKNEAGEGCDFTYITSMEEGGRVYTEINAPGIYSFANPDQRVWDNCAGSTMHTLKRRVHDFHARGCASFITVGQGGNGPVCLESLMTLEGAWLT